MDREGEAGIGANMPRPPDAAVQETSFAADVPAGDTRTGSGSVLAHDTAAAWAAKPSSTRAMAPDLLRGVLMALMVLDHSVMQLRSWPHGTSPGGERDSVVVHEWNRPVAYVVRTLTHLCAPGFTFLLGMGVVFLGRSRAALGWSWWSLMRHFVVRTVVLTVTTVLLGLFLSRGKLWFMNIVLFALAVDYLLVGLLWLLLAKTEPVLAYWILKVLPDKAQDDASEPLIRSRRGLEAIAPDRKIMRASDASWHAHNLVLLAMAVATIFWNLGLSPTHGHCAAQQAPLGGTQPAAAAAAAALPANDLVRIWFYPVAGTWYVSAFPPLAWLSFALLGLLYGRVLLARTWSGPALALGNMAVGLAFALLLVLTRLVGFGNLSEGCLQTADQGAHPGRNAYLASARSFFYVTKYPPDVAFWALSLGANHILLAVLGAVPATVAAGPLRPLLAFGRSALFFYVVHMVLLTLTGPLFVALLGHDGTGFRDPMTGRPVDGPAVDQLWGYFGHWVVVLAIMWPLCEWYAAFKSRTGVHSIWRFF
ncbi:hypothetical protein P8C59_007491 [Phyllachora maydis]|uniref:Heparan-alpha-glucosaminide N-acetyltransferase catalytic domain-containing protein n=1 Tax=Phyllachora maydis TaxID=1825666 RepID=A0AAD9I8N1_9PEZI|nr:hypothetical protein P8C59_007491 [Phyllachora maydis]